jgi:KDO2-lipid IV(A) lauroyltransferase
MPGPKVSFKQRCESLLLAGIIRFVRFAPAPLIRLIRSALGALLTAGGKRRGAVMAGNLRSAFPEKSAAELRMLARAVTDHFLMVLFENIRAFARRDKESLQRRAQVNGIEHLRQALNRPGARPGGAILLTAHFGNWEIIPLLLGSHGPQAIFGIVRPMDNPLLEKKVLEFRRFMGADVIYKRGSLRALLEKLAKNSLVVMLIDQNTLPAEGVFVDFFSRPAATTPSAAHLHLKKNVPLVPLFVYYQGDRIVLDILPAVRFQTQGDFERDRLDLTQRLTTLIEEQVRRHPEQWLWFHNRWKTRPPGGGDEKRE